MKKSVANEEVVKWVGQEIDIDMPLQPSSALQQDKLSRKGFAGIAASALRKVPSSAGLVVSIEGAWGSGKTSVLAMIEALLLEERESATPVIVHFNPWLVGEKDALLRHFLSRIASAIKLTDHSKDGQKVAREIKAYAKVFDLVKLIPGAEPWASMIKSVVAAAGDATESISEYKTPDVEAFKQRVEVALRKFGRPIIVFIDDIDRLFPSEVFEMVRIIKAVGGLPHLGYVVAWDSSYVSSALHGLGVPFAASYLDKVVQVRMPLPSLSLIARRRLIDKALEELDPEAMRPRFRNQDRRLGSLYHSGLRDLLDQPRDIARVFNAVRMMEPLLRGEIVFSDILGLAALTVKAPSVFELLRKKPRLFVGTQPDDSSIMGKPEEVIKQGNDERHGVYEASGNGRAVQKVVHFLFFRVAEAEDSYSLGEGSYVEGCISHPAKLAIALQLSVTDGDVSLKAARMYLQEPERRQRVIAEQTDENCDEFLDLLGELGESLRGEGITDLDDLCLSIARLVEAPLFVDRARSGMRGYLRAEDVALRAIGRLVQVVSADRARAVAELIANDPMSLSCAAEILTRSYVAGRDRDSDGLKLPPEIKVEILGRFSKNVLRSAKEGHLFGSNHTSFILWTMARLVPEECPGLFSVLKGEEPTLDKFALAYLAHSWDSYGIAFSLPRDDTLNDVYCSLQELKEHAAVRLQDQSVQNPLRAAWRSVVEGRSIYGFDGSDANR
jgi:hypothetical protein